MQGTPCVNHADRDAVGNCSRCHRFFCGACLGLDSKMQPICASCEKEASASPESAAPGSPSVPAIAGMAASHPGTVSPMGLDVLKHKMADDDPLGLLSAPAPIPVAASTPAPAVSSAEETLITDEDAMEIDVDIPSAPKPQAPQPAMAVPMVKVPAGSLLDDLLSVSPPVKTAAPIGGPSIAASPAISGPSAPISKPAPAPVIPAVPVRPAMPQPISSSPRVSTPAASDLDDFFKAPQPAAPAAKAPDTAATGLDDFLSAPIAKPKLPTVTPVTPAKLNPEPKVTAPMAGSMAVLDPMKAPLPKLNPSSPVPKAVAAAIPAKLVSLPDEDLRPKEKERGFLAGLLQSNLTVMKIKIPFIALAAGFLVFLGIVGWVAASALSEPSIRIADSVAPLQIVQVDSGQIADMDITTYSDIEAKLQAMQFTSFIQMTVTELPSPNFFNVQMKPEAGTYAEVIKMPGQLKPVLSYVTVFTNGVWYSTNGWDGKNQELEYLVSEFDPADDPDQLYVAHIQGVDKLKSDKGWETQTMSEDRYMAALSDHVRWYLDYKNIAGYQADFADWH
jgi:hypothetical protein